MSEHGMIALILVIVVVVALLAVLVCKEAAEISFKKYKEQLVKKALEQGEQNEDQ